MPTKTGLNWDGSDFIEVVAESAYCLRSAMSYAHSGCQVKKWVDAKLLEILWSPYGHPQASGEILSLFHKDVVRSEMSSFTPKKLWEGSCNWEFGVNCPRCNAGGLLARVLLGPMDWLFECERKPSKDIDNFGESPLLWVVAKLFDQFGGNNFYRTLSGMERDDSDYRIGQLLFRIPEVKYQWFQDHIADFSSLLREFEDKKEVDYCLVCTEELWQRKTDIGKFPRQFEAYQVSGIISALDGKATLLRNKLLAICSPQVSQQLSRLMLNEKTRHYWQDAMDIRSHSANGIPDFDPPAFNELKDIALTFNDDDLRNALERATNELEECFYDVPGFEDGKIVSRYLDDDMEVNKEIGKLVKQIDEKSGVSLQEKVENLYPKLANYFIWLKALHPDLGSYTVRYAANYRLLPDSDSSAEGSRDRLQNACFVIVSRELPSPTLIAASRVSLTHCLGPLEDYYAIDQARKISALMARADVGTGMFHNLRQYLHSLQKYSGALENITKRSSGIDISDVALIAQKLSDTLAETFRFQGAVFDVLTLDVTSGRIGGVAVGKAGNVRDQVALALRLLYDGAMGAIMLASQRKNSMIGDNDFNTARVLIGCNNEVVRKRGSRKGADFEVLAAKASTFVKDTAYLHQPTGTLQEISAAFAELGVTVDTSGIDEKSQLPENLCYLVMNEMLLNAMRASLWFNWVSQGPASIQIKTEANQLHIINTAMQEDIDKAMIEPRRPLGKSSGWGRWATREMIKLTGWKLVFEPAKLDNYNALSTILTRLEDH